MKKYSERQKQLYTKYKILTISKLNFYHLQSSKKKKKIPIILKFFVIFFQFASILKTVNEQF